MRKVVKTAKVAVALKAKGKPAKPASVSAKGKLVPAKGKGKPAPKGKQAAPLPAVKSNGPARSQAASDAAKALGGLGVNPRTGMLAGHLVGEKGNMSKTGYCSLPSAKAMAERNPDAMSNSMLVYVWNRNIDAAVKAGIEAPQTPAGGSIRMVRKESPWFAKGMPNGWGPFAVKYLLVEFKRRKLTFRFD